jgi:hypothetical protein
MGLGSLTIAVDRKSLTLRGRFQRAPAHRRALSPLGSSSEHLTQQGRPPAPPRRVG